MGLLAADIVLSSCASKSLENLETGSDPNSASIARRIRALKPILLSDCLHGEVVKKDRIPKALKGKHGVENLFVEDFPSFWRLLYTIVRDRGARYIVVVEIVDHGTYDRWFRSRGR
jgi:hypothetical protein